MEDLDLHNLYVQNQAGGHIGALRYIWNYARNALLQELSDAGQLILKSDNDSAPAPADPAPADPAQPLM
jgi:hypothetical protein